MSVNLRSERFLHWWAVVTVVVMGLVTFTAHQDFPAGITSSLWARAGGGVLGAIVALFYFRMLFECIVRRGLPRRALWILFLLVMPLFSAIVYFMTTRSVFYQHQAIVQDTSL